MNSQKIYLHQSEAQTNWNLKEGTSFIILFFKFFLKPVIHIIAQDLIDKGQSGHNGSLEQYVYY